MTTGDGRIPFAGKVLAAAAIVAVTVSAAWSCDRHANSIHGAPRPVAVVAADSQADERRWILAILAQTEDVYGAFQPVCDARVCAIRLPNGGMGYLYPDGRSYIATPDMWRLVPRPVTRSGRTFYRGGWCSLVDAGTLPDAQCMADKGLGDGGAL